MKTAIADSAPSKKSPTRKTAADQAESVAALISAGERHHLISVAAYYIAERRGFHGASSHSDWLQAEQEIDAMISAGRFVA